MRRKHAQKAVESEGGEVVKSVTAEVNYVLTGDTKSEGPSTAEKKAVTLNQNKGPALSKLTPL